MRNFLGFFCLFLVTEGTSQVTNNSLLHPSSQHLANLPNMFIFSCLNFGVWCSPGLQLTFPTPFIIPYCLTPCHNAHWHFKYSPFLKVFLNFFFLLCALPLTILAAAIISISDSKDPFKVHMVQGSVHHSLTPVICFF